MVTLSKSYWLKIITWICQWRNFPFHPLIFAVAPVLLLFQTNNNQVQPSELVLPLAGAIFISCSIFLVSKFLFRSWNKAAILSSYAITVILSYGYIKLFLSDLPLPAKIDPDSSRLGWNKLLFGLIILGTVILGLWLWRTKRSLRLPNKALMATSLVLIALPLANVLWLLGTNLVLRPLHINYATVTVSGDSTTVKRDIYYLVPEDYASNSILASDYHFDNSHFTQWLSDQGFYVADKARTNYPRSSFSLASTLRMDYLQNLPPQNGDPRPEVSTVFPRLQNPLVGRFFQSQGYAFIQMSSWFEPTRTSAIADEVLNFSSSKLDLSHFQRIILDQSMVGPLVDDLFTLNDIDQQYYGLEYQYREFPGVVARPGPKFVFAHIIMPHGPAVYDQDCNRIDLNVAAHTELTKLYLNMVQCANLRLETMITDIRHHDPEAIILLQSDEGSPGYAHEMSGDEYHFAGTTTAQRQERTEMLAAYYFPDGGDKVLYPTMSPVNSFRLLLTYYFGAKYDRLPDKTYLTPDSDHLFNFIDATDELNKARASQ